MAMRHVSRLSRKVARRHPLRDARLLFRRQCSSGTMTTTDNKKARPAFYLAHMNYARLRAPLDDPTMGEFRLALDPINALARVTPGFVWSLNEVCDEDRATVPLLRDDPLMMPQLSLWENATSLRHFAFSSGHAMYLKRKKEWFHPPPSSSASGKIPYAVCWWWHPTSDDRAHPSLSDAFDRLAHLQQHGSTATAFDLKVARDFDMPISYIGRNK